MSSTGDGDNAAPCLALDIGASKIDGAVVSANGTLLQRERLNVRELGNDLLTPIVAMLQQLQKGHEVSYLGVGCAGPMTRGGEEVSPLNIPQWRNFPLRSELEKKTGLTTFVDGDARALALAEGEYGAAKNDTSYISMVVSTGIGGGIVVDGRLLDGETGNSGHVGHINVVPDGNLCSCGARGCLEAEASGWAIEAMTGKSPKDASSETRSRTAELVGRGIGSLCSVLDISNCYVAGSVALGFGDEFFHAATKAARSVARLQYSDHLKIERSGLGDEGPLLGAALVGRRASK
ncbi:MAG: ROK family protein [Acidimicrobiaceae bacterium]